MGTQVILVIRLDCITEIDLALKTWKMIIILNHAQRCSKEVGGTKNVISLTLMDYIITDITSPMQMASTGIPGKAFIIRSSLQR